MSVRETGDVPSNGSQRRKWSPPDSSTHVTALKALTASSCEGVAWQRRRWVQTPPPRSPVAAVQQGFREFLNRLPSPSKPKLPPLPPSSRRRSRSLTQPRVGPSLELTFPFVGDESPNELSLLYQKLLNRSLQRPPSVYKTSGKKGFLMERSIQVVKPGDVTRYKTRVPGREQFPVHHVVHSSAHFIREQKKSGK
jgi:hypothetical protein